MKCFPLVCAVALTALLGCRATPPSRVETKAAYWTKHHVTIGGKHDVTPVKATNDNIEDGKELFTSYCMICHGMDGQNTGVPFTMSPPAPVLTSREVQDYTDGQLKWVIDYGIWPSGMPGSKGTLSDDEIWSIVVFLRHLPPPGSAGEPEMYTH